MAEKKISIAFPRGGIIPASVLGKAKDFPVEPHKAVAVPETYGRHLIDDRFAYEAETKAQKAKAEPQTIDPTGNSGQVDTKAEHIAKAEKAVTEAEEALGKAGDDLVAKAAAENALKTAEAALAALKA